LAIIIIFIGSNRHQMELNPIEGEYKSLEKKHHNKSSSKNSTKVVCPNCSHVTQSKDINIQDKIAKCSSCHEVFTFQNELQTLLNNSKKIGKPTLGKQKNIDVLHYKGELNISVINYTDWTAIISFLLSVIGGVLSLGLYFGEGVQTMPFIIAFVMLFIFSVYRFINYKNNKTFLDVDDRYLYIRHRPKNFHKDKIYERKYIKQLYTKVYGGIDTKNANSISLYYHLWMVYDGPDGEEHIKVALLQSKSHALYLEQELESFLDLPNQEVPF